MFNIISDSSDRPSDMDRKQLHELAEKFKQDYPFKSLSEQIATRLDVMLSNRKYSMPDSNFLIDVLNSIDRQLWNSKLN